MSDTHSTVETYPDFNRPPPPIEGGGIDPKRIRRAEINPYGEGHNLGRNRVKITPAVIQHHVDKWESSLLSKLGIIDSEIKELEKRRRSPLLFLGLIFGLLFGTIGFLIAIAVDYWLVADFWNTIFANEFGEVPENLATSPFVKALQVVVAALALHFFFQYLGRTGKRVFVYTMAFLSVILLLGIGVWVANENLPPGFTMFGVQLTEDTVAQDTTLEDLGLAPPSEPNAAADEGAADRQGSETLNNALGVMWFLAFGIIFLVVTGVAALSLGVAARAAAGIFGPLDREVNDERGMNRHDIAARLERARVARRNLVQGEYRLKILRGYKGEFLEGYLAGLGKGDNAELREAVDESMNEEVAFANVDHDDWTWVIEDGEGEREGKGDDSSGSSASDSPDQAEDEEGQEEPDGHKKPNGDDRHPRSHA